MLDGRDGKESFFKGGQVGGIDGMCAAKRIYILNIGRQVHTWFPKDVSHIQQCGTRLPFHHPSLLPCQFTSSSSMLAHPSPSTPPQGDEG